MNLDDTNRIKELDSQNMISSIEHLPQQITQTLDEIAELDIPDNYKNAKRIVFSGTGGSALGAFVVKHLYGLKLPIPFEIIDDYNLPAYVNEDTLVVCQTYSGTTEEMLEGFDQAVEKGAMLFTVSAGGTLYEKVQENGNIHFTIDPKFNPSNQPRMAIGYAIFALVAFLQNLGFLEITSDELREIQTILTANNEKWSLNTPLSDNYAKQLANKIHNNIPIFVAGEHLVGSIHTSRNQMNENAKSLAVYFSIPQLNHYLLEGLTYPNSTKDNDFYIILNSDLYSRKLKIRTNATKEIISNMGHKVELIDIEGRSKLSQVVGAIHLGSYIGFYISMLNEIDPSPIPNVESFKKMLREAD